MKTKLKRLQPTTKTMGPFGAPFLFTRRNMFKVKRYYKGELIKEYKTPIYPKELKDLDEKDEHQSWELIKDKKGRTVEANYTPTIWKITVEQTDDN